MTDEIEALKEIVYSPGVSSVTIVTDKMKRIIALLEAANLCADALDANWFILEENSDDDDLAIVDQRLKAWRKEMGK